MNVFSTISLFISLSYEIFRLPHNNQGQSQDPSVGRSAGGTSGYYNAGAYWSTRHCDQARPSVRKWAHLACSRRVVIRQVS